MLKTQLRTFILIVVLATTVLGLGGCRKEEKTPPPAVQQKAPGQQILPSAGQGKSPLATPNTATSPVKK